MFEGLAENIAKAGKEVLTIGGEGGSSVLVLPYGGRVIGLFPPRGGENFLWTSPALGSPETARALLDGAGWVNTGGDRTWLAPEIDVFLPDYPKVDRYVQPRALDPGEYRVAAAGRSAARLAARISLVLSRSKRKIDLELTKEVVPAPSPLRREADLADLGGAAYAGFRLRTTLEIIGDGEAAGPVGIWSLLQLPHGGDLLVPTYGRTSPRVYFGTVRPEDLAVSDRLVRWRMRAEGEHKIGLRAASVTGRAGYLHPIGRGLWDLVVRSFSVDPSGEYVDVPASAPDDLGYAFQACNVASGLGRFSEMEHHAPAIGKGTGRSRGEDLSTVWAFRGSEGALRAIARRLLGKED